MHQVQKTWFFGVFSKSLNGTPQNWSTNSGKKSGWYIHTYAQNKTRGGWLFTKSVFWATLMNCFGCYMVVVSSVGMTLWYVHGSRSLLHVCYEPDGRWCRCTYYINTWGLGTQKPGDGDMDRIYSARLIIYLMLSAPTVVLLPLRVQPGVPLWVAYVVT